MPISHYFSRYFYGVTRDVNRAKVRCKWAVFDFFSHDAFWTVSNTAWVRTMNCRFDALGLILNLATLFLFSLKFATEFFFSLKNWTVVEETYTFMEICQWPEISRRDLIPYE